MLIFRKNKNKKIQGLRFWVKLNTFDLLSILVASTHPTTYLPLKIQEKNVLLLPNIYTKLESQSATISLPFHYNLEPFLQDTPNNPVSISSKNNTQEHTFPITVSPLLIFQSFQIPISQFLHNYICTNVGVMQLFLRHLFL